MKKIHPYYLLLCLLTLSMTSPCLADIVVLKNGNEVRGKILHEDDQRVIIKVDNGIQLELSKKRIQEIILTKTVDVKRSRKKEYVQAYEDYLASIQDASQRRTTNKRYSVRVELLNDYSPEELKPLWSMIPEDRELFAHLIEGDQIVLKFNARINQLPAEGTIRMTESEGQLSVLKEEWLVKRERPVVPDVPAPKDKKDAVDDTSPQESYTKELRKEFFYNETPKKTIKNISETIRQQFEANQEFFQWNKDNPLYIEFIKWWTDVAPEHRPKMQISLILFGVSVVLALLAWMLFLVGCFRAHILWGLLYLLASGVSIVAPIVLPIYVTIFIISKWSYARKALAVEVLSVVCFCGSLYVFYTGMKDMGQEEELILLLKDTFTKIGVYLKSLMASQPSSP